MSGRLPSPLRLPPVPAPRWLLLRTLSTLLSREFNSLSMDSNFLSALSTNKRRSCISDLYLQTNKQYSDKMNKYQPTKTFKTSSRFLKLLVNQICTSWANYFLLLPTGPFTISGSLDPRIGKFIWLGNVDQWILRHIIEKWWVGFEFTYFWRSFVACSYRLHFVEKSSRFSFVLDITGVVLWWFNNGFMLHSNQNNNANGPEERKTCFLFTHTSKICSTAASSWGGCLLPDCLRSPSAPTPPWRRFPTFPTGNIARGCLEETTTPGADGEENTCWLNFKIFTECRSFPNWIWEGRWRRKKDGRKERIVWQESVIEFWRLKTTD